MKSKKIKYFTSILSIIALSYFSYIYYQKERLEGIWILNQLEYKIENKFDKTLTIQNLLKIDNSNFEYITNGGYSDKLKYSFNGFRIIFDTKENEFISSKKMNVNSNKLILEDFSQRETFTKIPNQLKSKSNIFESLKAKVFVVMDKKNPIDTLSFKNNIILSKSPKNYNWEETKYERKRLNDIEFYLLDGYFIFIPNNIENQLYLNVINNNGEIIQYEMNEI